LLYGDYSPNPSQLAPADARVSTAQLVNICWVY
jgi:hypothetical protein